MARVTIEICSPVTDDTAIIRIARYMGVHSATKVINDRANQLTRGFLELRLLSRDRACCS